MVSNASSSKRSYAVADHGACRVESARERLGTLSLYWDSSQTLMAWDSLHSTHNNEQTLYNDGSAGIIFTPYEDSGLSPGFGRYSPIAERLLPPANVIHVNTCTVDAVETTCDRRARPTGHRTRPAPPLDLQQ